MNRTRLLNLIAVLNEKPDAEFNVRYWVLDTPCGTVGCIAGQYVMRRPQSGLTWCPMSHVPRDMRARTIWYPALENHFGLTPGQAGWLFDPYSYPGHGRGATRAMAIGRIERQVRQRYANRGTNEHADQISHPH